MDPTPVLLPGKSHGQRSLVGCHLWGRTESDTTEATQQQQQQQQLLSVSACFRLIVMQAQMHSKRKKRKESAFSQSPSPHFMILMSPFNIMFFLFLFLVFIIAFTNRFLFLDPISLSLSFPSGIPIMNRLAYFILSHISFSNILPPFLKFRFLSNVLTE